MNEQDPPAGSRRFRLRHPLIMAMVGFLLHGPGVRLLTDYRFTPALLRINIAAIVATLVAAAVAALLQPSRRRVAAILAFAVGHLAWSLYLAIRIFREPPRSRGVHSDP